MAAYHLRKRIYQDIMSAKARECNAIMKQAKDEFAEHSSHLKFVEEQDQIENLYQQQYDHNQLISFVSMLKDKNLLNERCKKHLQALAPDNAEFRWNSSTPYFIIRFLLSYNEPNIYTIVDIMVKDGMDLNPQHVLMKKRTRNTNYGAHYFGKGIERMPDHYNQSMLYLIKAPLINTLFCAQEGLLAIQVLEYLIINGLTDFGLTSYFYIGDLINDLIAHNYEDSEITTLLDILIRCGVQHGGGMVRYHQRSHSPTGWRNNSLKIYLEYVTNNTRQPLCIQKQAALTIRRVVGGVRFKDGVESLPLPKSMKNFVLTLKMY